MSTRNMLKNRIMNAKLNSLPLRIKSPKSEESGDSQSLVSKVNTVNIK